MSNEKRDLTHGLDHSNRTETELLGIPVLEGQTHTRDDITMGGPEIIVNQEDAKFLEEVYRFKRLDNSIGDYEPEDLNKGTE